MYGVQTSDISSDCALPLTIIKWEDLHEEEVRAVSVNFKVSAYVEHVKTQDSRLTQFPQSHIVRSFSFGASGAAIEQKYEKSQTLTLFCILGENKHFLICHQLLLVLMYVRRTAI